MKTAIIVQARMTSTRLPGKILKEVLNKPLLAYQLERLKRVRRADEIIIATTINDTDQAIVDFCHRNAVNFFRGSEEDVLSRYYEAASQNSIDTVVRITSDCPLIDPEIIDKVIELYQTNIPKYDYISNCLQRTYPRGMDTEVFSYEGLQMAYLEATRPPEREHVTPFFYTQPARFSLANVAYGNDESEHRWTVDTIEDFTLIKNIIEALYPVKPDFSLADILRLLKQYPQWKKINAHIEQKKL